MRKEIPQSLAQFAKDLVQFPNPNVQFYIPRPDAINVAARDVGISPFNPLEEAVFKSNLDSEKRHPR